MKIAILGPCSPEKLIKLTEAIHLQNADVEVVHVETEHNIDLDAEVDYSIHANRLKIYDGIIMVSSLLLPFEDDSFSDKLVNGLILESEKRMKELCSFTEIDAIELEQANKPKFKDLNKRYRDYAAPVKRKKFKPGRR